MAAAAGGDFKENDSSEAEWTLEMVVVRLRVCGVAVPVLEGRARVDLLSRERFPDQAFQKAIDSGSAHGLLVLLSTTRVPAEAAMAAELAVNLRRASRRLSVWLLKGLSAPAFRSSLFARLEGGGPGASAAIEVFLALGPEIDPDSRWTDPHRCAELFRAVIQLLDSDEHAVVVSAVRLLRACSIKASKLTPLLRAVLAGDHKGLQAAIDTLKEKSELESTTGAAGQTALWWSCALGNRACAVRLLAAGASATVRGGRRGLTTMMAAARSGNARVIEVLLTAPGMSSHLLNARADGGTAETAIYMAAELGHAAVVLALLAAGAMAEARVSRLHTLLGAASAKGHEHALAALLDDPDAASGIDARNEQGRTALYEAALFGRSTCAKMLVAAGAHSGVVSKDGTLALLAALSNDSDDYDAAVVSCLVSKLDQVPTGALEASRGSLTMLHLAALHGHTAAVKGLLARGASPTVPSADGFSALAHACMAGKLGAAQCLAATGKVSLSEPSRPHVDPPIVLAAAGGHEPIVRWLLAEGVSPVTSVGRRQRSALMVAARAEHAGLVAALLEVTPTGSAGVGDAHGHTALHYAAKACGSDTAVVSALLKAGLDPSTPSTSGQTAFWLACKHGRAKAAKAMLQASGRKLSLDAAFRGQTALMAAVEADSAKTVKLLALVGAKASGVPDCVDALTVALLGRRYKALKELLTRPKLLGDLNIPDSVYWRDLAPPTESSAVAAAEAPAATTGPAPDSIGSAGTPTQRSRAATSAVAPAASRGTIRRATASSGGRLTSGEGMLSGSMQRAGLRGRSKLAYRVPLPPMMLACVNGAPVQVIAALLDAGCDGTQALRDSVPAALTGGASRLAKGSAVGSRRTVSALTLAAEARAWDVVKLLIERRCVAPGSLTARDAMTGDTVLHKAAEDGATEAVEHLLRAGASPTAPAGYGWTPLQYAAALGYGPTVRAFLGNALGASAECVEHADESGFTAIELAAARGRAACVAALHGAGAATRQSLRAAAGSSQATVVQMLLTLTEAVDKAELDASLMAAVNARSASCVKLLVAAGAAISVATAVGAGSEAWSLSPLHQACIRGHHDIVKILIASTSVEARADAVAGESGRCAVEQCRAARSANGVSMLLWAGADGEAYDEAVSGAAEADMYLKAETGTGEGDIDEEAESDDDASESGASGSGDAAADAMLAAATASL